MLGAELVKEDKNVDPDPDWPNTDTKKITIANIKLIITTILP